MRLAPMVVVHDGGGIYRQVRLVVLPVQHTVLLGGAYLPSTVTGTVDKATKTALAEIAHRLSHWPILEEDGCSSQCECHSNTAVTG